MLCVIREREINRRVYSYTNHLVYTQQVHGGIYIVLVIFMSILTFYIIIILLDMLGVNLCIGMVGSDEIEEDCGVVVF